MLSASGARVAPARARRAVAAAVPVAAAAAPAAPPAAAYTASNRYRVEAAAAPFFLAETAKRAQAAAKQPGCVAYDKRPVELPSTEPGFREFTVSQTWASKAAYEAWMNTHLRRTSHFAPGVWQYRPANKFSVPEEFAPFVREAAHAEEKHEVPAPAPAAPLPPPVAEAVAEPAPAVTGSDLATVGPAAADAVNGNALHSLSDDVAKIRASRARTNVMRKSAPALAQAPSTFVDSEVMAEQAGGEALAKAAPSSLVAQQPPSAVLLFSKMINKIPEGAVSWQEVQEWARILAGDNK